MRVNTKQSPSHNSGESTWIDLGKSKNKNYYYYNFKTRPRVDLGQSLGHGFEESTQIDRVHIRIKKVIIIVLKHDSRVYSR